MKLFRAEITKVIYVFAEDEDDAELEAPNHAEEDVGYEEVHVSEATDFARIENDWKDSIPYSNDSKNEMTIREFFERPLEPEPYVDPPEQQKLWP